MVADRRRSMRLVLLGAPGCGKGTQGPRLVARYGIRPISTGDILRAEIRKGSEFGLKADEYVGRGALVPDNLILDMMEKRINEEVKALKTPLGYIPVYEDLKKLFREFLDKDYTEEQYIEQFKIHIPENIAKLDRIETIYRTDVTDTPQIFLDILQQQRERLLAVQAECGDHVSPFKFMDEVVC